jgi:transposase
MRWRVTGKERVLVSDDIEGLRIEIALTHDVRYLRRLYATLFLSSGNTAQMVGDALGEHPRTIQRWAKRFAVEGVEGLRSKKPSGRPPMIDAELKARLIVDLRNPPNSFGYTTARFWYPKLLGEHLQRAYGIALSLRQCERVFNDIDHRRRRAL